MAYSHMLMVRLGKEVGDVVWWEGKHYVLLAKFFKKLYMLKIFYIVVLGNSVTFSPNLSKFSRRNGMGREGGWRGGGDLFDKPFRNFLFFESDCKICQLRIMKTLANQN